MLRVLVKLGRVSASQIANIATELNHGALHSQAKAEEWDAFRASIANGGYFAFDAAFAETARYQDAVVAAQEPLGTFCFNVFAANAADAYLRAVRDAGM